MGSPDSKPNERKLTENLLAGFDRTGRTPKTPPVTTDFVDFHRKPLERPVSPPRTVEPTFVIRPKRAVPSWLPWVGVVLAMLGAGAGVAWLVRPAEPAAPAPLPSFSISSPPVAATTAAPSVEAPVEAARAPAPAPSASIEPSARRRPAPLPKSGFVRQL